jgi:hypothetical protein
MNQPECVFCERPADTVELFRLALEHSFELDLGFQ